MFRFTVWTLRGAVLLAALWFGTATTAFAQHHGGGGGGHASGGFHGGGGHVSGYHGGGGYYHGGGGYYGGRYGYGRGFGYYPGFYGGYYGGYSPGYYSGYYNPGYYSDYGYPSSVIIDSTPYISNYYAPSVDTLPPIAPASTTVDTAATITVRVPPNADVWFDDQPTKNTGTDRLFASPPLESGRTFYYNVRARWTNDQGKVMDQTRRVDVTSGRHVAVDFMRPQQ
jgi:uncharacterized protein (TIGR03000 family)